MVKKTTIQFLPKLKPKLEKTIKQLKKIIYLANNMGKKDIQANFKLSEDFNRYVIKNPRTIRHIPSNACIVMTSKSNPKLTEKNINLAKEIMKKEHKPCFKAVKKNRKWMIEAISV